MNHSPLLGPPLPDGQPIRHDLACARCAYNLRGLPTNAYCPECGTAVSLSLHGNWLHLADPGWLRKLRLGAALKLWGLLAGLLVGFVAGAAGAFGAPPVLFIVITVFAGLLSLTSVFLITSPEPTIGRAEDPINLRQAVRICAVAGFCGGQMVQGFAAVLPLAMIGHLLTIVGVIAVIGEFVYLRRFARRMPDEKLARQTTVVMWGMGATTLAATVFGVVGALLMPALLPGAGPPATGVTAAAPTPPGAITTGTGLFMAGGCIFGIASLVFGILYVILLFRFYGAFKRITKQAEPLASVGA